MFITVNQTISEISIRNQAPPGFQYDDPWGVAKGIAQCLRQRYAAWLESKFPDALIEVDKVKEGNGRLTTGVQVVVFRFGRNDLELKETIEPYLNLIWADFDMSEIDKGHLLAKAG